MHSMRCLVMHSIHVPSRVDPPSLRGHSSRWSCVLLGACTPASTRHTVFKGTFRSLQRHISHLSLHLYRDNSRLCTMLMLVSNKSKKKRGCSSRGAAWSPVGARQGLSYCLCVSLCFFVFLLLQMDRHPLFMLLGKPSFSLLSASATLGL